MKTIEKKLTPGEWKLHIQEAYGHNIISVGIKGMRDRTWPLFRVDEKSFRERHGVNDQGELREDGPALLRGMPTSYMMDGLKLYLWPAPLNEWVLHIEAERKNEAAAR